MKRLMLSLILALSVVSGATYADQTTITTTAGLSDAQKAELAAEAAKMVSENASTAVAAPSKTAAVVREWADIGTAIGTGLAASAKELGVAANDFAKTPVGKFTVFLIAWHFIGNQILHYAFALLWFFTMTPIMIWYYRVSGFTIVDTHYEVGKGPNGAKRVVNRQPLKMTDGKAGFGATASAIAVIAFILLIVTA